MTDSADSSSTREIGLQAKVALLERPEAYRERPRSVDSIETHMSWVFLTDEFVYKLKKPISYDVLDFSTLELRHRSCERELALNRRLAEHVYLDVVPLTLESDGRLAIGGDGEAVEWLVKMRRLPADRMLDRLIAERGVERDQVEPAATLLARFYRSARRHAIDGPGYRRHLTDGVQADRVELMRPRYGLSAASVERVIQGQMECLQKHPSMFEERVQEGRVIEGHGDLRPEHICLSDPPAIIDCLEFSADLLVLDPVDELSFLSLECRRLGAPEIGGWFLEVYREVTGDAPPGRIVDFYLRYRAMRRAKIAIWHLRDPSLGRREHWLERASWYIGEAEARLCPARAASQSGVNR